MGLRRRAYLGEAVYQGNMGFEEMVMFYRKASKSEVDRMERMLRSGDFKGAWKLLGRVTGVRLMRHRNDGGQLTVAPQEV